MALRDMTMAELQAEHEQARQAHELAARRRKNVAEEIARRDRIARMQLRINELTAEERQILKEMLG